MTNEEWLMSHFEFGFGCAVNGWKTVPSSSRQDVTEARRAGFDAGREYAVTYDTLAKTKAEEWVVQRNTQRSRTDVPHS